MEENLLKERKETLMALMNDKAYVPMKLKELAILLGVPKEDRGELEAVLKALMADGKIAVSKKGKYARAEIFAETGVFTAHYKGFGFVSVEGRESDLFIAPDNTGDAMDGDTDPGDSGGSRKRPPGGGDRHKGIEAGQRNGGRHV